MIWHHRGETNHESSIFFILVIGLVVPGTLWAKNLALELDGKTAIEVPNSDSLNPKDAITIEAWMNMSKPVGECLAKDWGRQKGLHFPRDRPKWKRIAICPLARHENP